MKLEYMKRFYKWVLCFFLGHKTLYKVNVGRLGGSGKAGCGRCGKKIKTWSIDPW